MIHLKHVKHAWKYMAVTLAVLLLLSVGSLTAMAEDTVYSGTVGSVTWTMNVTTGELSLTGNGGIFSVPWAAYKTSIKKVTVADTVTAIPSGAFSDCASLTEVDLGDGVTSLWDNAFRNCTALTEITLPDALVYIYYSVFSGCTALERVNVDSVEDWMEITFVDENSNPCSKGARLYVDGVLLTELNIPEGTAEIGKNAFSGLAQLESVTVSEGVTAIGSNAFRNCGELTLVTLPSTLTSVGMNAFAGTSPAMILFEGTASQWQSVTVDTGNELFASAVIPHAGHTFDQENPDSIYFVHAADCVCPETYLKSCVCGMAGEETFTVGDALGHTGGHATCKEQAVCDVCHLPYGETLPHTPGTQPTCTEPQTCTVCHTILTPVTGHSYTEEITPPTCTARGYTTHTCTACGHSYADTYTDALSHTPGAAATCTAPQTCTVCHTVLAPKADHSYTTAVTRPTCTEGGYTTYTCSACDHSYTADHTEIVPHTPGAAATCTAPQTCTVCHTILTPAAEHDYVDTVTRATCTHRGYTTHTCSQCNHRYVDAYTDVLPHTPGAAATCTEAQLCTACSTVLTLKTSHSYTETVTQPTCTDRGYTTHTCTACGRSYADTFTEAKGHKAGTAATCTAPQSCSVCDAILVSALGHSFTDTVTAPTCTHGGYTTHACDRCDRVTVDTHTEPAGHVPGAEATCTSPQSCMTCGVTLTDMMEHAYTDTVVPPTCSGQGYTTHTCDHCGRAYTDGFTDAEEHTPGAWVTDQEPTAHDDGLRHRSCVVCGRRMETEVIPALGEPDTEPADTETDTDGESEETDAESESETQQTPGGDGAETLSADDLLGNLTGCKKAQTIGVYVLIGLLMIVAAVVFWRVDTIRKQR